MIKCIKYLVVFNWYVVFWFEIKSLGFEKNDRVFIPNTRDKKTFGLNWTPRYHYFNSRSMCEITLWRLGVVEPSVTHSSYSSSDCEASTVKLIPASVPELSSFVNNLIKCWKNIIPELDLSYRCHSISGESYAKSSYTLFIYIKLVLIRTVGC